MGREGGVAGRGGRLWECAKERGRSVAGRGGEVWQRRVRCVVEESVDCDIAIDNVLLITGVVPPT